MLTPLVMALNGKRSVELKLNSLMGNKLITTDNIFVQYNFVGF